MFEPNINSAVHHSAINPQAPISSCCSAQQLVPSQFNPAWQMNNATAPTISSAALLQQQPALSPAAILNAPGSPHSRAHSPATTLSMPGSPQSIVNEQQSGKPCIYCGKTFTKPRYVLQHVATVHMGIRKFVCDAPGCTHKYAHADALRRHKEYHHEGIAIICSICSQRFTDDKNLNRHIKIHNNNKNYKCQHCGQTFSRSDSKTVHERKHHAIRPY